MWIICNVLIFKYYIKNRALWSIPVFIKKVNDMQVFYSFQQYSFFDTVAPLASFFRIIFTMKR